MMFRCEKSLVLAAVAVVCTCSCALAAPVGTNEAARAMKNWRQRRGTLGTKLGKAVKDVRKEVYNGTAFHVVRFEGGGHAIVPTDTKLRPVLMFSGSDDFVLDERNPALALLMADIKAESSRLGVGIDAAPGASTASVPRSRNENEWADLLDDNLDATYKNTVDDVRVAPLLATRWAQDGSKTDNPLASTPYCYNFYTPNNYPCGCVATATAQIMKYFEWPKGSVDQFKSNWTQVNSATRQMTTQGGTFDWANMPDSPNSDTPETQRQAIGKLTSDVGIIYGMHYTSANSVTWTTLARYALTQTVLGYSNAVVFPSSEFTGVEYDFKRVMTSNFNAKRPVQLGIGGHSIVGDGYGYNGGTLYYHLNMGWAGSWDYWYSTPVNEDNPIGGEYTSFQHIVYNIYTTESPNLVILSGRVTDGGTAVANMPVVAQAADGTEVANAVTDGKGIYALLVPPGEYTVVSSKENADHKSMQYGTATGTALECVTAEADLSSQGAMDWPHGTPTLGNCADCDIALETVEYDPEAVVSIGDANMLTNFASATIPVTVQVVHYGQTAESASVIVTLTPVGGGTAMTREFVISGDFNEHTFNAAFGDLTAGGDYEVSTRVVMGSVDAKTADGGFAASRKIAWFDETDEDGFTPEKWTGGEVKDEDGKLSVTSSTFTPGSNAELKKRIDIRISKSGAYTETTIPALNSFAGVSTVVRQNGQIEVVVGAYGTWQPTGVFLTDNDGYIGFNVVIELDFAQHSVSYSSGSTVLGTYNLPPTVADVSSIKFDGYATLSEFSGSGQDANLVKDANGIEYATYDAAKAAGATGVLSPLWLSTWDLGDVSGFVEVNDPKNLIVFTGASEIIDNEPLGGNTKRVWFANKKDIEAGAKDYIGTTKELGLTKPISTNSVMKIDDFVVANGAMSFRVEIDDAEIAKEKVKEFIEVCDDLVSWDPPNPENIDFDPATHFITVTPPPGDSYFTRIKIPEDPVK